MLLRAAHAALLHLGEFVPRILQHCVTYSSSLCRYSLYTLWRGT